MSFTFNTLDQSVALVVSTLELDESLETIKDVQEQLEQTAGYTITQQKVYREHYVIAIRLWLALENNLISGEGAKFDQAFETTRRHLVWQQLKDKTYLLNINEEFTCDALLQQITPPSESEKKLPITIGFLGF